MTTDDDTLQIRSEAASDRAAVYRVHAAAFPTDAEARLVDALREAADPYLAFTAVRDGRVLGHVAFSPLTLDGAEEPPRWMGLAPMAVHPDAQGQGVGGHLVRAGLDACRQHGATAVFLVGEPDYYGRFGFTPAADHGLFYASETFAPYFLVHVLQPGALAGRQGQVRYHPAFDAL